MEITPGVQRIAKLTERDIGPTEENVKQKVIVPLLELLGHSRESLEFEYRTARGGKIDIFVKNVPADCKVIIDTKNYAENLSDYVEQVKQYAFDEAALLTVLANGTEIRIYSPLRGVAFERSLLYCFQTSHLTREDVWRTLSDLLHSDNLRNRSVLKTIDARERQIKDAMSNEETLKHAYGAKIQHIDTEIERNQQEIAELEREKERLEKEAEAKISNIWNALGLPVDLFKTPPPTTPGPILPVGPRPEGRRKAGRVSFQELLEARLVKDGQTLYFYHTRPFRDERAHIIASSNKLRYQADGNIYSISRLAELLLRKHGFKRDEHGVAGPKYWRTGDGKLLDELNEQIRARRGDRR